MYRAFSITVFTPWSKRHYVSSYYEKSNVSKVSKIKYIKLYYDPRHNTGLRLSNKETPLFTFVLTLLSLNRNCPHCHFLLVQLMAFLSFFSREVYQNRLFRFAIMALFFLESDIQQLIIFITGF